MSRSEDRRQDISFYFVIDGAGAPFFHLGNGTESYTFRQKRTAWEIEQNEHFPTKKGKSRGSDFQREINGKTSVGKVL